jgi:hypothetical protein
VWAELATERDRAIVAAHLNAVHRYLERGDPTRLLRYRGIQVTSSTGEVLDLVTDLATIDRLAEGGEIHYELYRR